MFSGFSFDGLNKYGMGDIFKSFNNNEVEFISYLEKTAETVNVALDVYLNKWIEEIEKETIKILPLAKAFAESLSGGKRIRAALVIFGYNLTESKMTWEILKPALAFEIFQSSILAHDDIVDKAQLRRGKPALYQMLGGDHKGISYAICLGDVGFFLSYKILSEMKFPYIRKEAVSRVFTEALLNTCLGELLDIEASQSEQQWTEDEILKMFDMKTAYYTVRAPLKIGAILGGANKEYLEYLDIFGKNIGIAFQIIDDIIGIFGNEKITGKPISSDIEEGKQTLLLNYAMLNATSQQKDVIRAVYGKEKINQEQIEKIKAIFIDTGALVYARSKADYLIEQAKKVIDKLNTNENKINLLYQLADFFVGRDK